MVEKLLYFTFYNLKMDQTKKIYLKNNKLKF